MNVKPKHSDFTRSERSLIRSLRTPEQVQRFAWSLRYNHESRGPTVNSFRRAVRLHRGHCLEKAIVAAAIMWQHGHAPKLLCVEAKDQDHLMCLYKKNGLWGAVDGAWAEQPPAFEPIHPTPRDIAIAYWRNDGKWRSNFRGFAVADLRRLKRNWITTNRQVWFVDDYLWRIVYRLLFPRNGSPFYYAKDDASIVRTNVRSVPKTLIKPPKTLRGTGEPDRIQTIVNVLADICNMDRKLVTIRRNSKIIIIDLATNTKAVQTVTIPIAK